MYVHDHLGRPLTSARMSVNGTRLHYRVGGQETLWCCSTARRRPATTGGTSFRI